LPSGTIDDLVTSQRVGIALATSIGQRRKATSVYRKKLDVMWSVVARGESELENLSTTTSFGFFLRRELVI